MSSQWEQLKEIKGVLTAIITAALACMALGAVIMEWRISVNVALALSSQDIGTDAKIVSMDDEIDVNGAGWRANQTRIDGNERRVEQAFSVLLGRDE
jgi:hypothetical protein